MTMAKVGLQRNEYNQIMEQYALEELMDGRYRFHGKKVCAEFDRFWLLSIPYFEEWGRHIQGLPERFRCIWWVDFEAFLLGEFNFRRFMTGL